MPFPVSLVTSRASAPMCRLTWVATTTSCPGVLKLGVSAPNPVPGTQGGALWTSGPLCTATRLQVVSACGGHYSK